MRPPRASRAELLGLLSSTGVDLPPKTKLTDAELDKLLCKVLDSVQYLTRVVPTPPLDPAAYPPWSSNGSDTPVLEAIKRHNYGEATMIEVSEMYGKGDPFPRLYTNAFNDLRQTLMTIANACDQGMTPLTFQDKGESSGICMRVLDVRHFDDKTPIVVVVYQHDLKDALTPASFEWISSYVSGTAGSNFMAHVTATVQEQHLLLRLLHNNRKRLASSYKPKRAATESSFTLSFLLPVGPLGADEMGKYNANNGCAVCGRPAKQKCSRCGAVRYCDAVCQKDDWKAHRPLCDSWQGAKWQSLKFVSSMRPAPNTLAFRFSKYDNAQHKDAQKRLDRMTENAEDDGPPPNTHGTTPFIVKVQLNSSMAKGPAHTLFRSDPSHDEMEMLIYDQRRTFEVTVHRKDLEEAAFAAVQQVLKKGDRGLKMFLWATRTAEWTIDVCLDKLPEWQKW
ncbi:MYND-type domain-containing protein [Favolaschia claudopus]|uniref:MYND-type domain-containing protein n=1 Tax=Favolaschia claudopus TaxID=2862362 RepID=A0AAV9Z921_9AGAR